MEKREPVGQNVTTYFTVVLLGLAQFLAVLTQNYRGNHIGKTVLPYLSPRTNETVCVVTL